LVLGRGIEGAGSLGEDEELSRRHARIAPGPQGGYLIEDLGSTNGTIVDGRRIESVQALAAGSSIELGSSMLVAEARVELPALGDPPAEPVRPEPPPRVSLRLAVDFGASEARFELDGEPEPLRLVREDGGWRLAR
jgi:pSer/pThr/pTyr-binding forkhead associated (FHA) protein